MKAIRVNGPAGVTLARDDHGVPHIRATDLAGAYWGMGYCHALDRGLQQYFMRVLGQGRVAELLDDSDASVEIDRFFRRMNWAGHTEAQLALLAPYTVEVLESYCAGVNTRLEEKAPWELRMLGYRPEPWTIADTVMLTRLTGYIALAQSQAEVERLYVELVHGGVSDARLGEIFPTEKSLVPREILQQVRLGERLVPAALKWLNGAPRVMASNNWVVAPSLAKSGNPLFANDPHLEVNRLPNVWVEQVVELPDDTVICANMPGLPAALLGRKDSLAWGATYTFMDAVDSWVEECRDGTYRRGEEWVAFDERRETIKRKKSDDIEVVFYENMHGVLDGDPHEAGYLLATRWASSDSGSDTMNATVDMWSSRTVDEGMATLGRLETAWNWVFAGNGGDGKIGYQMSGRMPLRHPDANGFMPMPGWDPAFDWQGWAAVEDLPRVIDPPEGFIVTANQDLNHLGRVAPINMPMGDYRARRIADRLREGDCDLARFAEIHMDVYSIQAEEFLAILLPLLPDSPSATLLKEWDRCYDPASRGAALFEVFYRELSREMFAPGGLGDEVMAHLIDRTGIFIDFYQNFDRVLVDQDSAWLAGRELAEVYKAAFDRARQVGSGTWGESNTITFSHILFGAKMPRWFGFNRGPVALRGGRATPHQGQIYESGGRVSSFGPSLRLMADMGDAGMHTAIAGGPSDRRFSRWYASGIEGWLAGEYKKLARSDQPPRKDRARDAAPCIRR